MTLLILLMLLLFKVESVKTIYRERSYLSICAIIILKSVNWYFQQLKVRNQSSSLCRIHSECVWSVYITCFLSLAFNLPVLLDSIACFNRVKKVKEK